jgi:heterodisulfide reductase subunit A-like polyferredoxin
MDEKFQKERRMQFIKANGQRDAEQLHYESSMSCRVTITQMLDQGPKNLIAKVRIRLITKRMNLQSCHRFFSSLRVWQQPEGMRIQRLLST